MPLSVTNGGIGKNPAISRVNRFSPEKESKAIISSMRSIVAHKDTSVLIDNSRSVVDDLWNPSVPISLDPCYPVTNLKANPLKKSFSAVLDQSTKELREHSYANSTYVPGEITHKSTGGFFSSPGVGSGGIIPVSGSTSSDSGKRGLFSFSDLQSVGQTSRYGRDDKRR